LTNKNPSDTRFFILIGAFLGALSGLALIGVLSLGDSLFGFPFVPFDIFDWMARSLPGWLIGTVISTMVAVIRFLQGFLPIGDISTTAKLAEQTIALLQLVAGGALFGALLAWQAGKPNRNLIKFGQIGGLVLLGVSVLIEILLANPQLSGPSFMWLGFVFLGWGWGLAWLIERVPPKDVVEKDSRVISRRQFLAVSGAGLAAAAVGAWGLGKLFGGNGLPAAAGEPTPQPVSGEDPFGAALTSGPAASPSPQQLAARQAPVNGTRPELTSNEEFYRIDINTRPPQLDGAVWRLHVNGLVDSQLELSLDDLRSMPAQTQILTMQCISNPIGGDLSSSSRWTGVRFMDVLASAGIQASAAGA